MDLTNSADVLSFLLGIGLGVLPSIVLYVVSRR